MIKTQSNRQGAFGRASAAVRSAFRSSCIDSFRNNQTATESRNRILEAFKPLTPKVLPSQAEQIAMLTNLLDEVSAEYRRRGLRLEVCTNATGNFSSFSRPAFGKPATVTIGLQGELSANCALYEELLHARNFLRSSGLNDTFLGLLEQHGMDFPRRIALREVLEELSAKLERQENGMQSSGDVLQLRVFVKSLNTFLAARKTSTALLQELQPLVKEIWPNLAGLLDPASAAESTALRHVLDEEIDAMIKAGQRSSPTTSEQIAHTEKAYPQLRILDAWSQRRGLFGWLG